MATQNDGEFEVAPASVLQEKYGLYAENRRIITINPAEVPEDLRIMIPYAERWGINCDITRGDYIDKQPEADVRDMARVVSEYQKRINSWLDAMPDDVKAWPPAAEPFLFLLAAWCEAACQLQDELR